MDTPTHTHLGRERSGAEVSLRGATNECCASGSDIEAGEVGEECEKQHRPIKLSLA